MSIYQGLIIVFLAALILISIVTCHAVIKDTALLKSEKVSFFSFLVCCPPLGILLYLLMKPKRKQGRAKELR